MYTFQLPEQHEILTIREILRLASAEMAEKKVKELCIEDVHAIDTGHYESLDTDEYVTDEADRLLLFQDDYYFQLYKWYQVSVTCTRMHDGSIQMSGVMICKSNGINSEYIQVECNSFDYFDMAA